MAQPPTPTLTPHRVPSAGKCAERAQLVYDHQATRIGITDMQNAPADSFPLHRLADDTAAVVVCGICGGDRERLTLGRGTPYIECGDTLGIEDDIRTLRFFRVEARP